MKAIRNELQPTIPLRPFILYHCGHEKCAPGHSFGPAIRPHYLLHFVRCGRGSFHVGSQVYTVEKGEGFLIYPGITTYYQADENTPWEYCWIGFDGSDVDTLLTNCSLSQTSHLVRDYSQGQLWDCLLSLIAAFHHPQSNDFACLGLLYQCFSHMSSGKDSSKALPNEHHITRAMEYIHNNYAYDIKITDISRQLSIDRTYLYKLFQKKTGVSPKEYLTRYRINTAQHLLETSSLSMSEIAYSCGFLDASTFDKHFKKLLHITPLQYRHATPQQKEVYVLNPQDNFSPK